MIDIHCHILPGVDDGPQKQSDTFAMLAQAIEDGVTDIIATPHHRNRKYVNDKKDVLADVDKLNSFIKEHQLPITVHPGQEVRIYGEIVEDAQRDEILTLAGTTKYVLVELPSSQVPAYTERVLYEMMVAGMIPIIAHPERNSAIVEDPGKLFRLINQGALSQVTAASVAGDFGKKIQRFSMELLEHHLAHFMASDAHDTEYRGFAMTKALKALHHAHDHDFGVLENAANLLKGDPLFLNPPVEIKPKGFWSKILSR
ncbi:tyrosine-protein phosphatase [Jeotgalibacillus proteolyticus]|uniref:Tyrosine-protein phosphatase n=1 Tax=Jeotgalibacillus proteolyticus TaxID=2082395 RepID=A0A2S5GBM4_9BACL|nr:CpsB/CapC family capsule biosynthesis tyrosine phosphatase [Jeotgalibacillus proteolyticus]PPA70293.1 tyrosine protein phosphatase [Jeotgalibacillus proteolyticus]